MARKLTKEQYGTRQDALAELKEARTQIDVHLALTKLFSTFERPNHAEKLFFRICSLCDGRGIFGPTTEVDGDPDVPVREALARMLRQENMFRRNDRKRADALYSAIVKEMIRNEEEPNREVVEQRVSDELEKLKITSLKRNVSSTMSEMVIAGLVERWYGGTWTDDVKPGGGRAAVYKVAPWAIDIVQGSELKRQTRLM